MITFFIIYLTGAILHYFLFIKGIKYMYKTTRYTETDDDFNILLSLLSWCSIIIMGLLVLFHFLDRLAD